MQKFTLNSRQPGRSSLSVLLTFLPCLMLANSAFATNGYFSHGMGTKNKAMAGSGIALPEEAISVVNNPASAILAANRMEIGLAIFRPRSNYFSSESNHAGQPGRFTIGPNELDAEDQTLLAPYFSRSWRLQNDSAFALALYGRPGINTEYRGGTATFDPDGAGPDPVVTRSGSLGDGDVKWKMYQALLDLSYARQVSERVSIGISGVLAAQTFKVSGIGTLARLTETFAASDGAQMPAHLSANGNDTSYGAGIKLGLHTQFTPTLSMGLMVQSKIYMSKFNDYSDLFPGDGDFDIPADFKFGLSWRALENVALSFDIEHIFYSGVDALGNSLDDLFRCPTAERGGSDLSACLGGKNGGGLGWDDATFYKFGLDWGVSQKWTLRAGFSFGHQPIPISDMTNNLFTPYLSDAHYTFGFTWNVRENRELNFALMYTEEESMNERNRFDTGQYLISEADQYELELSYGWRF
jgi:long-chain fatty acid transport protein